MLLARAPEELQAWKAAIEVFLDEHLALRLNPRRERLRLLSDGVDFLGYIVRPFHLLVRRRVVGHLGERLARSRLPGPEQRSTARAPSDVARLHRPPGGVGYALRHPEEDS